MRSTPSNPSSKAIKLAGASLVLSIASLVGYASIMEDASAVGFLISTGGAFAAGIVSLLLALAARNEPRQKETKSRDRLLVTVSIVVAIGYIVCLGIIALNIIVYRVL